MKHGKILGLVILGLAVLGFTGSAFGQAETLMAKIPFAFTVENTTLPAGSYDVQMVSMWEFVISNAQGDVKVAFVTEPTERMTPPNTGLLEFNDYGNHYFLSKIWFVGDKDGFYIAKTTAERAFMKKGGTPTKTVPLAKKK
jgi:hypothetical protein